MDRWIDIHKINRELDDVFFERYLDNESNYYKKNCIELVVEIAELANETKCFKYWSVKSPIKDKVLEEYADTITMILHFFTWFKIDLEDIPTHYETEDVLLLFNKLFIDASSMIENGNEELVKKIFSNILYLGELLRFSEDELIDACYKKMNIIKERLNSEY